MLLDRPMYAYEVGKGLRQRFGFSTATVTTYVVLYKLQREGLIQVEEEVETRGVKERNRKYYKITDLGRKELEKGRELLHKTIHSLE